MQSRYVASGGSANGHAGKTRLPRHQPSASLPRWQGSTRSSPCISRGYQPKDGEGEQLPPESTKVQVKTEEVLRDIAAEAADQRTGDAVFGYLFGV